MHAEASIRREAVTVLATMSNVIGSSFGIDYLHPLQVRERRLIDYFVQKERKQLTH